MPLESERPPGLGRKRLHWVGLGFPCPILLSWQMLGGWSSQPTASSPGLGCWEPSVIPRGAKWDERQLSEPQKEAHFTGAQLVCPWGILGCQLDTEG